MLIDSTHTEHTAKSGHASTTSIFSQQPFGGFKQTRQVFHAAEYMIPLQIR